MKISVSHKKLSPKLKTSRNQKFVSFFLSLSILLCINIFFFQSLNSRLISKVHRPLLNSTTLQSDPCTGRYIYMYDLPKIFNVDILRDCKHFNPWANLCPITDNSGLGPRINNLGVFQPKGWYDTEQFMVSVIFHNRMKQYECLTSNYSISDAVYVPYYPGLDVTRYLWNNELSKRNFYSNQLVNFLKTRPEWVARGGRDHFVVIGRTMWDFQLGKNSKGDWGNSFTLLPEVKNMSILTVESRLKYFSNEFGIPYPTYFHPSKKSEVIFWQEKVRSMERPWLFSFVGAPRRDFPKKVRNHLIDQCAKSTKCKHLECGDGGMKCTLPSYVMKMFKSSIFCLEPPGDSYTRRSVFDSILAGCIPVFFNYRTAHAQYKWHLPKNFSKFSVYIPEETVVRGRVKVEDVLLKYNEEQIKQMREEVIKLIPTLVYNDPRFPSEGLRDAFDVAVDGVAKMIKEKLKDDWFSKFIYFFEPFVNFFF